MNTLKIHEKSVAPIEIENLILDPQNPRLPPSIQNRGEPEFIDFLIKSADVLELMGSIGSRGYFGGEPILVTPEGAEKGKYIVVEGNCRLAASKLLKTPSLVDKRKKTIQEIVDDAEYTVDALPCVIYETRDEILDYLGYRHIKGAHAWDTLQKARYLDQLKNRLNSKYTGNDLYRQLAKEIGSKSNYVASLLASLNLYEKIHENDFFDTELTESDISFSLLTTSLSYNSICKFLGLKNSKDVEGDSLDIKNLEQLTKWLFEENKEGFTRLGESRNLKTLAAVVESEEALIKFNRGLSLDEAENWTHLPKETYELSIQEARNGLKRASDVIYRVSHTDEADLEQLKELNSLIIGLSAQVKDKLAKNEDDLQEI